MTCNWDHTHGGPGLFNDFSKSIYLTHLALLSVPHATLFISYYMNL